LKWRERELLHVCPASPAETGAAAAADAAGGPRETGASDGVHSLWHCAKKSLPSGDQLPLQKQQRSSSSSSSRTRETVASKRRQQALFFKRLVAPAEQMAAAVAVTAAGTRETGA
jgi:hypothetical protein